MNCQTLHQAELIIRTFFYCVLEIMYNFPFDAYFQTSLENFAWQTYMLTSYAYKGPDFCSYLTFLEKESVCKIKVVVYHRVRPK